MAERFSGLSIVMPAYNEEDVLPTTIERLCEHLDGCGFVYEILVANDGSTDGTSLVLHSLESRFPQLRHTDNPGPYGYGCAVRCGLADYAGDAVAIVMADGSDRPVDVEAYYRKILEGYDMAFGTRFVEGATVEGYPRLKLTLNRLGNWLISRVMRSSFRDFTNGFKCYRREVIDAIQPLICGNYNLTVEMSMKAVATRRRIAVVPNDWHGREAGQSKFSLFRVSWTYLVTVLYCWSHCYLKRQVARPARSTGE